MDNYDATTALERCNRMWLRLGRALEAEAHKRAKAQTAIDREQAIMAAKLAEGCYWQATGDCDVFDLPREAGGE